MNHTTIGLSESSDLVTELRKQAEADLDSYTKVKAFNVVSLFILILFLCLVGIAAVSAIIDNFKNGIFDGIIASALIIFLASALSGVAIFLFRMTIGFTIWAFINRYVHKRLKQKIPSTMAVGDIRLFKNVPGILVVDYQNKIVMFNIYKRKYRPSYIRFHDINGVNVTNEGRLENITTFSSNGKKGTTETKKKDDIYLEIHYQIEGNSPNWIRIPFGERRLEAKSIAAALLIG